MNRLNILLFDSRKDRLLPVKHSIKINFPDIIIHETEDEQAFFTTIANGQIDMIILDQTINGKNWFDYIMSLRKENIAVPFLIVLDEPDEETYRTITEYGGLGCIVTNENSHSIKKTLALCRQMLLKKQATEVKTNLVVTFSDELTGVLNRKELIRHLNHVWEHTLLLLNIDDFNLINSTYGYHVGDFILQRSAALLAGIIPDEAMLFRPSGDEFIVLLALPHSVSVKRLAKNINRIFSQHFFTYQSLELRIGFSIGIAQGKGMSLLKHADIALRRGRKIGKNRYEEYVTDNDLEERQKENIEWANHIKDAIKNNHFLPFFQPIINNRTQQIDKYECLARMLHHKVIISPVHFIEPSIKAGLLPYITRSIIAKSFDCFKTNHYDFSVNISENDLQHHYLFDFIKTNLDRFGIRPDRFIIEITEIIQSADGESHFGQIRELRNLGIKIAIDDFGKGHSNFSRLLELHPDYIKIDGSFIRQIDKSRDSYNIAYAIAHFARSINTDVIAEHVHNERVFEKVRELDIQYSQGYFFGKPGRIIQ
ncbi:MAG: bifunctional diguanylate cyclase/phosphodiesterase [Spirochaetales bacterium]|nr:bifunctional diguanylate cyclase/phosphodiesterase [Spirochaetales bacterium]